MEESLQISQVAGIEHNSSRFSRMGDDYVFSRMDRAALNRDAEDAPVRFNGITLFLCRKGECSLKIDLEKYEVTKGSLTVIGPGSLVSVDSLGTSEGDVLFLSSKLLNDVHIDPNVLGQSRITIKKLPPVIMLTAEEFDLVNRYMELLHYNAVENSDTIYSKNISRTIASAVLYQILQIFESRYAGGDGDAPDDEVMSSRRLSYVHRFSQLLRENYRRERSVGFYASKLCISPKYLSHIIKEATGSTAASWIDRYVIIEAKNLLKFSGRNVQQVTYDLNFPNQSSFGKYFKHLTGMSPTEYQKS